MTNNECHSNWLDQLMDVPLSCDVPHWFVVNFADLDCRHWGPFVAAALVGMQPEGKITIPLPSDQSTANEAGA